VLTKATKDGAAAVLDKLTHTGQLVQSVRRVLADQRRTPSDAGSR
jgi:hypothetical protein